MITDTRTAAPKPAVLEGPLSQRELYRLTLFKWRYAFEAYGFQQHQVEALLFLKWLYATRRLRG